MSIHLLFLSFIRCRLAILLFLCFSCSSDSGSDQNNAYVAQELRLGGKSIRIPLDGETSHYSLGLGYNKTETPLLFNFNPIKKSIQVYDLQKQQLSRELVFEEEGSEGIGRLNGFHVHNLDSIFVFTSVPGTMFLTDLEQSYLSRIVLDIPDGYVGPEFCPAPFNANPIIRGDKMLAKVVVLARIPDMEESQLSQQFLSAEFSLVDGNGSFSAHKYPIGYLEKGLD